MILPNIPPIKNSLRNKILLPFLFMMAAMAILSTLLSVYLLTETVPAHSKSLLIMGIIGCFFLACLLLMMLYTVIIRKITTSIDILSVVSEKVALGDLNQHLYIQSDDEIGRLAAVFNTMIVSLKESSHQLQEETRRSEAILASMPNAVVVTDIQNRLILANNQAEELFNISADKLQGQDLLAHIKHQDVVEILKEQSTKKNHYLVREAKLKNRKGQDKIFRLTSTVAQSKEGSLIGIITVLEDITHDKELDELREGFLRTVSHELRTPLTSIVGFIDLLLSSSTCPVTPKQKECLDIVSKEANSLKSLIEDLLDLSRIRAGKTLLTYATINVADLFTSLCYSFHPLAKGKGLTLSADSVDPSLTVQADPAHLRRILINLISNAIKFTNVGSVTIGCTRVGDFLKFSVKDTGIGLLEEEKSIIFERFRQVDYSQTRKYEGIGLGLSIVKQLVELHQGSIEVESDYGKGSAFLFYLPITTPFETGTVPK